MRSTNRMKVLSFYSHYLMQILQILSSMLLHAQRLGGWGSFSEEELHRTCILLVSYARSCMQWWAVHQCDRYFITICGLILPRLYSSDSSTLHECHRTFYAASLHLLQSIARVIACATELYAMSRVPSLRHSRTGTELNRPCEGWHAKCLVLLQWCRTFARYIIAYIFMSTPICNSSDLHRKAESGKVAKVSRICIKDQSTATEHSLTMLCYCNLCGLVCWAV